MIYFHSPIKLNDLNKLDVQEELLNLLCMFLALLVLDLELIKEYFPFINEPKTIDYKIIEVKFFQNITNY